MTEKSAIFYRMVKRAEKIRRSKLRKAAGLKRFSEISAEHQRCINKNRPLILSGPDYLVAFACFDCHKSFKKRPAPKSEYKCPQCSGVMAHMGRSFKAPRKSDRKQWKKVERLWSAGYRFHTNTSRQEISPYPRFLRETDEWIAKNPRHPFRLRELWPRD